MHLKSFQRSPGEFISSHIAMILAALLGVFLQIAKIHPVLLHALLASEPNDLPIAEILNVPWFYL
jgi:hypothetical protein